jgi:hypothetical protein
VAKAAYVSTTCSSHVCTSIISTARAAPTIVAATAVVAATSKVAIFSAVIAVGRFDGYLPSWTLGLGLTVRGRRAGHELREFHPEFSRPFVHLCHSSSYCTAAHSSNASVNIIPIWGIYYFVWAAARLCRAIISDVRGCTHCKHTIDLQFNPLTTPRQGDVGFSSKKLLEYILYNVGIPSTSGTHRRGHNRTPAVAYPCHHPGKELLGGRVVSCPVPLRPVMSQCVLMFHFTRSYGNRQWLYLFCKNCCCSPWFRHV